MVNAQAAQVSLVPSGDMALDLGNPRVANVILLGSLSHYLDIPAQIWRDAIGERVPPKVREVKLRAFDVGRDVVAEKV